MARSHEFRRQNIDRDALDALKEAASNGECVLGYATIFPDPPNGPRRVEAESAQFKDGSVLVLQGSSMEDAVPSSLEGRIPGADIKFESV